MSLDVYLTTPGQTRPSGSGIFVRDRGATREISREEWDRRRPGREPVVLRGGETEEAYHGSVTHNLIPMAKAAGLYEILWTPEALCPLMRAEELSSALAEGLAALRADPEKYRALNPANGWGDYDSFVAFVAEYLDACEEWPGAVVGVSS